MATNNAINNTLQTPFNVGATSVTTTGTQLNLLNALTLVPITRVNIQAFTTSGTYTPTVGLQYCDIEAIGGGASGGGAAPAGAGAGTGGGGGGSGGYSRTVATAATIGASQVVTIGAGGTAGPAGANPGNAGGTTSLGSICIALGGFGGQGSSAPPGGVGGSGAATGTGTVSLPGGNGNQGLYSGIITVMPIGGSGGNTLYGDGGPMMMNNNAASGTTGTGFGAGGGGGVTYNNTGSSVGGVGQPGLIIVTEYISQ